MPFWPKLFFCSFSGTGNAARDVISGSREIPAQEGNFSFYVCGTFNSESQLGLDDYLQRLFASWISSCISFCLVRLVAALFMSCVCFYCQKVLFFLPFVITTKPQPFVTVHYTQWLVSSLHTPISHTHTRLSSVLSDQA